MIIEYESPPAEAQRLRKHFPDVRRFVLDPQGADKPRISHRRRSGSSLFPSPLPFPQSASRIIFRPPALPPARDVVVRIRDPRFEGNAVEKKDAEGRINPTADQ